MVFGDTKRLLCIVATLAITIPFWGCNSAGQKSQKDLLRTGPSSSSLQPSGVTDSGILPTAASKEIAEINAALNSSEQYVLAAADVETLKSSGILNENDEAALRPFLIK